MLSSTGWIPSWTSHYNCKHRHIISQIFYRQHLVGHKCNLLSESGVHDDAGAGFHDYDRGFDSANVNGNSEWWYGKPTDRLQHPAWLRCFKKNAGKQRHRQSFITRFADHLFVTYHPSTITKVMYHAISFEVKCLIRSNDANYDIHHHHHRIILR